MKIAQILIFCLVAAALADEAQKNFYLEAYYKKFPRSELIKLLYKIEEIRNEGKPVIGGVHDFVHLLDTDQLAERVAKEVESNPEFQDGNIERLSEVNFANTFLGLEESLKSFKREKLERVAYGVEKYIRIRRGQEGMTGGLLDVVPYIQDDDLVLLIVKLVRDEKELQNSVLLELLGQHELASIDEFEDSLKKLDKKTLVNFLIACELHDKNTRGIRRRGGYHDYAWSLSKFDLIKAIVGFSGQHIILRGKGFVRRIIKENKINLSPFFHGNIVPDLLEDEELYFIYYAHRIEIENDGYLNNTEFLDLTPDRQRKIIKSFLKNNNENHEQIRKNAKLYDGGFNTFLETTGEQILSNYCCAAEDYYRKTNEIQLFGGVHDYIKSLTKGQKIEFILKYAKLQNELFMEGELDTITEEFGGCH